MFIPMKGLGMKSWHLPKRSSQSGWRCREASQASHTQPSLPGTERSAEEEFL